MPEEKNSGWFRHRVSGQVFEAAGHQFREATKNKDLEAVDPPDETTDQTPDAALVAVRERLTKLGQEWHADESEETLNKRLEAHAVVLRAHLDQLGVRHMPNFKVETLAAKVAEAVAAKTQTTAEG